MAHAAEPNPTLARRTLAVRLRRLRDQNGYDLPWLAKTLGVALSQASRLDTGARGFRLADVERLCREYQLPAAQARELVAFAEQARRRAWWQQVDLTDSYRTLIGLEQVATEIAEFCSTVLPGLLQTPKYAEAAVKYSQLEISDPHVVTATTVRMRRQKMLDRPGLPEVAVVIDEAALARGPAKDVMRDQLDHLLAVSTKPNIRIQVIPFSRGLYPGGDGQFILLRLPAGIPDIYYAETQLNTFDTDAVDIVQAARQLWNMLQGIALSTDDSVKLIAWYRSRLK